MKKGISRGNRFFMMLLATLFIAASFLTMLIFVEDSTMRIEYSNGTKEYFIPFFERDDVEYEDSELYSFLFQNSVEDITRMCVIKNQMETNGQYDPNKEIDICQFAHRSDSYRDNNLSAKYKLDDLINWGNKGVEYKYVSAETVPFGVEQDGIEVAISRYKTIDEQDLISCANNYEEYKILLEDLNITVQELFYNYKEYIKFNEAYGAGNTNMLYCVQMNNNGNIVRFTNMDVISSKHTIDEITGLFNKQRKYLYYNPDKMTINTNTEITAIDMRNILSKYDYSLNDNSRIWVGFDNMYGADDSFMHGKKYYESKTANTNGVYVIAAIWISFFSYISIFIYLISKEGRPYFKKKKVKKAKKKKRVEKIEQNDNSDIHEITDLSDIEKLDMNMSEADEVSDEKATEDLNAVKSENIIENKSMMAEVEESDEEDEEDEIAIADKLKNGILLKKIDNVPIEFLLIISFGIIMFDLWVGYCMVNIAYHSLFKGAWVYALVVAATFVLNYTFMPLILMYARIIKARAVWENSCIRWIITVIHNKTLDAYDNGHVVIRTWIPYIIYLLINLILVVLGLGGIAIAFVLDIIVGMFWYKNNKERQEIVNSINIISNKDVKHKVDTSKMHGDNLELASAVNNIGDGIQRAVESSMKNEKMKADLITNVSHDIKTPLTSIINYVDLLKRENIQDEKVAGYIEVLEQKSQRLKQLTDDLVEASKISSGNISLHFDRINLVELINQSIGEYEDKFAEHGLKCRFTKPEKAIYISADSKSMFRIVENLYNNIYKYALQGTRVYIELDEIENNKVQLSVKNISENQLNMSVEELLERFKQGDESRNTEGSGLGLSIAKSLTEAMKGEFDLSLDGDLFKVILTFDMI